MRSSSTLCQHLNRPSACGGCAAPSPRATHWRQLWLPPATVTFTGQTGPPCQHFLAPCRRPQVRHTQCASTPTTPHTLPASQTLHGRPLGGLAACASAWVWSAWAGALAATRPRRWGAPNSTNTLPLSFPASRVTPAGCHVLLVDDERLTRTVVANLLLRCGYKGKPIRGCRCASPQGGYYQPALPDASCLRQPKPAGRLCRVCRWCLEPAVWIAAAARCPVCPPLTPPRTLLPATQ